ncbi:MAG: glycosyltransferase family 4 protein [Candidatus Aenigmarchaeota archaeon]|nr:glycosyltransferase family 4 protein [Candidatus Aenigmarchaeota archaeon]
MKRYRVFLNVGEHPIYDSIIKFPPQSVIFVNYLARKRTTSKLPIYERRRNIIRKMITKFTSSLRIPRMFIFQTNAELIHSSRGIIPLNKIPWVMDIEHAKSFFDDHKSLLSERARKIVRKFLLSKYCKKILPHSFMAYKSLTSAFGKDIEDRMKVIYPAIDAKKFRVKHNTSKVKLLFVANKFFEKGGKEVLEAFDVLNRRYDVELTFKCSISLGFKKRYEKYGNIKIIEKILPYETLFKELYAKSNIFIFPTYIDTFGFSLLEAMSVGLPLVATNIFAISEIIENGKNGFLVESKKYDWSGDDGLMRAKFLLDPQKRTNMYNLNKPDIVRQLVERLSLLIEDSSLRKRMGRYGRRLVEKGKFSIKERNKKLRRIYQEVLSR